MKGTLMKTEQGWVVRYDRRTLQDPSAEDGELPLLPDDLWVIDHTGYALGVKQEIEFEEITEDIVNPINKHLIKFTYAKLIHHSVDTTKMINHIGDVNEMVDHVPDVGKMVEDVEKLAEKYPYGGREGSKRLAFIDGYNTAKETLFTECQVREAIMMASTSDTDFLVDRCDEIIKSLKQAKQ